MSHLDLEDLLKDFEIDDISDEYWEKMENTLEDCERGLLEEKKEDMIENILNFHNLKRKEVKK